MDLAVPAQQRLLDRRQPVRHLWPAALPFSRVHGGMVDITLGDPLDSRQAMRIALAGSAEGIHPLFAAGFSRMRVLAEHEDPSGSTPLRPIAKRVRDGRGPRYSFSKGSATHGARCVDLCRGGRRADGRRRLPCDRDRRRQPLADLSAQGHAGSGRSGAPRGHRLHQRPRDRHPGERRGETRGIRQRSARPPNRRSSAPPNRCSATSSPPPAA